MCYRKACFREAKLYLGDFLPFLVFQCPLPERSQTATHQFQRRLLSEKAQRSNQANNGGTGINRYSSRLLAEFFARCINCYRKVHVSWGGIAKQLLEVNLPWS